MDSGLGDDTLTLSILATLGTIAPGVGTDTIVVEGTDGDDIIVVDFRLTLGTIELLDEFDLVLKTIELAAVSFDALTIAGLDGADTITVFANSEMPITVDGGAGADKIIIDANGDTVTTSSDGVILTASFLTASEDILVTLGAGDRVGVVNDALTMGEIASIEAMLERIAVWEGTMMAENAGFAERVPFGDIPFADWVNPGALIRTDTNLSELNHGAGISGDGFNVSFDSGSGSSNVDIITAGLVQVADLITEFSAAMEVLGAPQLNLRLNRAENGFDIFGALPDQTVVVTNLDDLDDLDEPTAADDLGIANPVASDPDSIMGTVLGNRIAGGMLGHLADTDISSAMTIADIKALLDGLTWNVSDFGDFGVTTSNVTLDSSTYSVDATLVRTIDLSSPATSSFTLDLNVTGSQTSTIVLADAVEFLERDIRFVAEADGFDMTGEMSFNIQADISNDADLTNDDFTHDPVSATLVEVDPSSVTGQLVDIGVLGAVIGSSDTIDIGFSASILYGGTRISDVLLLGITPDNLNNTSTFTTDVFDVILPIAVDTSVFVGPAPANGDLTVTLPGGTDLFDTIAPVEVSLPDALEAFTNLTPEGAALLFQDLADALGQLQQSDTFGQTLPYVRTVDGDAVRLGDLSVLGAVSDALARALRNEIQKVTVTKGDSSDFRLTFDSMTTDPIAMGADAAAVQTALGALDDVEEDDFIVVLESDDSSTSVYIVEFTGQFDSLGQVEMTGATDSGTGSVAVKTLFEGGFFQNLKELAEDVQVFLTLVATPEFTYNPATATEASSFTLPLSFDWTIDQTLDINPDPDNRGAVDPLSDIQVSTTATASGRSVLDLIVGFDLGAWDIAQVGVPALPSTVVDLENHPGGVNLPADGVLPGGANFTLIVEGVVGTGEVVSSSSTTEFVVSGLGDFPAAYVGQSIQFTSGALDTQIFEITAAVVVSPGKVRLTIDGDIAGIAATDTFEIIGEMPVVIGVSSGAPGRDVVEKLLGLGDLAEDQFELLADKAATRNGGVLTSDAVFDLVLKLDNGTDLAWSLEVAADQTDGTSSADGTLFQTTDELTGLVTWDSGFQEGQQDVSPVGASIATVRLVLIDATRDWSFNLTVNTGGASETTTTHLIEVAPAASQTAFMAALNAAFVTAGIGADVRTIAGDGGTIVIETQGTPAVGEMALFKLTSAVDDFANTSLADLAADLNTAIADAGGRGGERYRVDRRHERPAQRTCLIPDLGQPLEGLPGSGRGRCDEHEHRRPARRHPHRAVGRQRSGHRRDNGSDRVDRRPLCLGRVPSSSLRHLSSR